MESRKRTFVLRLIVIALVVSGLLVGTSGPVHAASVERHEFIGSFTGINPCNGETFVLSGPVAIMYHAGTQHTIHVTFKKTGIGSLGNTYKFMQAANGQFAAPTAVMGSTLVFEVPLHGELISTGSAPNVAVSGTTTVFVKNGQPRASHSVAVGDACHD